MLPWWIDLNFITLSVQVRKVWVKLMTYDFIKSCTSSSEGFSLSRYHLGRKLKIFILIGDACLLLEDCQTLDEGCTSCVSGQKECKSRWGNCFTIARVCWKWHIPYYWFLLNEFFQGHNNIFTMGRGGGQVVIVLAFYSNDPSSIPLKSSFILYIIWKERK